APASALVGSRDGKGDSPRPRRRRQRVMHFSLIKVEDVVVVELQGEVWGGWDAVRLKENVGKLIETGERRFVVDLSGCGSVNSSGIGILLAVQENIRGAEGTMALCEVNERARRAFSISEVWNEFESKPTRAEGLRSMGITESNP